ncbi:MAG: glutamyl-tRNA reductase [Bacteroidetes bacterium]|nr:glutamyl-tRNA reductase [Bacteroidota bacterium]
MNIHAIGTSHKHASLELRERVSFSDSELGEALDALRKEFASEAAVVSTCNRTEIYLVPRDEAFAPEILRAWLSRWKGVEIPRNNLFTLHAAGAARHLFQVSAGIDSQVIGDIQIIGQVRTAYQIARRHGAVGKILDRLFATALHTGKRVKSETDIFSGAVSISYVAVELARKIFHPIANKSTLVVGAGDAGELAARNLRDQGVRNITITNRTDERARELMGRLGFGTWMPLADLPSRLHEFDIVIVSTGSPTYLINYADARAAAARRQGEPQLIVDISMPRNVDPLINTIPSIFCKDLNDLTSVVEANVEKRRAELPRAEMIIADELSKFAAWCDLLPVTPVIAQLKSRGEEIARAELEKNRGRFNPDDFEQVERLVASVVRKLIGIPMRHLLDTGGDAAHAQAKAEYVRMLFNLNGDAGSDVDPDINADADANAGADAGRETGHQSEEGEPNA